MANKEQIANQYTPEITTIKNKINDLKQEIGTKEAETNALYETYIAEAEGRKGTKLLGKGPVYEEKREKHDAALAELQQIKTENKTKIIENEAQIAALLNQQTAQINSAQPIIDGFGGLMARIDALNELPWLPSFFIFLLFLAIETSPILAKLIASKGEYDFKTQDVENSVKNWVRQKENQREKLLNTDALLNEAIYNELADEKELYHYKKQKAREILQFQADAFYNSQKKVIG